MDQVTTGADGDVIYKVSFPDDGKMSSVFPTGGVRSMTTPSEEDIMTSPLMFLAFTVTKYLVPCESVRLLKRLAFVSK